MIHVHEPVMNHITNHEPRMNHVPEQQTMYMNDWLTT